MEWSLWSFDGFGISIDFGFQAIFDLNMQPIHPNPIQNPARIEGRNHGWCD